MAQAARDPLFYACLAIAEQDAAFVGDMCIRCHSPRAWISGRSDPTNGSAINASDRDGINCSICHRFVDPVYEPGVSPIEDLDLLNQLTALPASIGGAAYILDRLDRRRGKRSNSVPPHTHLVSPFFAEANLCATCHDVSNPVFDAQPDGTYVPNTLNRPHPTGDKYDAFPIERTFSEWLMSDYALGGIDTGGRFGGNNPIVSTCQDCHLPDSTSMGANQPPGAPVRNDLAAHDFVGGNAWVQSMIINLYPGEVIPSVLQDAMARAVSMLQRAATLDVAQVGDAIRVQVTNESGHKLPTGYPEGRRMWINVVFTDSGGQTLREHGAYDTATADLSHDTKIFEAEFGLDQTMANLTGLPVGVSFHFAINNKIFKDNRIPPRGFFNANFKQVQASPVEGFYPDGRFWDDTLFTVPASAVDASVRVYYQTTAKEYITFLRDENITNNAGQVLHDQWAMTGKSPPVLMVSDALALTNFTVGDFDNNQVVNGIDWLSLEPCLMGPGIGPPSVACEPGDLENDSDVDLGDVARFQRRFGL